MYKNCIYWEKRRENLRRWMIRRSNIQHESLVQFSPLQFSPFFLFFLFVEWFYQWRISPIDAYSSEESGSMMPINQWIHRVTLKNYWLVLLVGNSINMSYFNNIRKYQQYLVSSLYVLYYNNNFFFERNVFFINFNSNKYFFPNI